MKFCMNYLNTQITVLIVLKIIIFQQEIKENKIQVSVNSWYNLWDNIWETAKHNHI
jgi:hypothetical protein